MEEHPGYCQVFKLGGKTGFHFYACCNNWNVWDESQPPSCDRMTYHIASKEKYCGSQGANLGGGEWKENQFLCGGCDGQQNVYEYCLKQVQDIPDNCWKFTNCFISNCRRMYQLHMAAKETGFSFDEYTQSNYTLSCGDSTCSDEEDIDSCPFDCCQVVNPQVCKAMPDSCTPECCGDSGCCLVNDYSPPIGTVIDWWQPVNFEHLPLPSGYEVCDGGNVTTVGSLLYGQIKPDLRHLFIMGGQNITDIGKKGGAASVQTSTDGSHSHTVGNGPDEGGNICGSCSKCHVSLIQCGHNSYDPPASTHAGGTHSHTVNNLPPYMVLLKLLRVI